MPSKLSTLKKKRSKSQSQIGRRSIVAGRSVTTDRQLRSDASKDEAELHNAVVLASAKAIARRA